MNLGPRFVGDIGHIDARDHGSERGLNWRNGHSHSGNSVNLAEGVATGLTAARSGPCLGTRALAESCSSSQSSWETTHFLGIGRVEYQMQLLLSRAAHLV